MTEVITQNPPLRHQAVPFAPHHITMVYKIAFDPFNKNISRTNQIPLFARKLNEYAFISLIGSEVKWDEGERGRRGERGVKGDGVNVTRCQFLFAILA